MDLAIANRTDRAGRGSTGVPDGAQQLFGGVIVHRQIAGFRPAAEQQVPAFTERCGVARDGADFLPAALRIGDGIPDFLGDGRTAAIAGTGVLFLLVDLAGLDNLLLDGLHIRFVDHLFLDGDRLCLRHFMAFHRPHRQGVVPRLHILCQCRAGGGVHGVILGAALAVRQRNGGFHPQKRATAGLRHIGFLVLRVVKDGQRGIDQLVQHDAHILLND